MEGPKKKLSKNPLRRSKAKKAGKESGIVETSNEISADGVFASDPVTTDEAPAEEVKAEAAPAVENSDQISNAAEAPAPEAAAPAAAEEPVVSEAPVSEEAKAPEETVASEPAAEAVKDAAARVSELVAEVFDDPEEAPVLAEENESNEVSAMKEEVNVEVKAEEAAPAPAPAPAKEAKKSVISNPDKQLVDMVKNRSFSGPYDKLPTYLL